MMLLQAPHRGVRLLAANRSALWATPLATGGKGAGLGVMGAGLGVMWAGLGAACPAGAGLGMYTGGGGAAWGSGCTLAVVEVVLPGSNLSAKFESITHGGLLEEPGAAGGGAGAAAGGRGCGGTADGGRAGAVGGANEDDILMNI